MVSRKLPEHMIRKHIREHSLVYQVLLIIGGTVVVGGGFILAVKKMQNTRETAYDEQTYTEEEIAAVERKPSEQRFPQPIGNETYGLRKVIRYALEAQGGREALEKIHTLRRIGQVQLFEEGVPQPPLKASIIFRRPGMLRYTYQAEKRSMVTCFDGEGAWWQTFNAGTPGPINTLAPEDLQLLKQDLATIRPLTTTLGDLANLSLIEGEEAPLAQTHYRIRHDLGGMEEVLYFNKENFLCERRDMRMTSPNGGNVHIRLQYEDFRYVDSLAFPFTVQVWMNEKKQNILTLDSVEVNIGVLAAVFRRPE